MLLKIKVSDRRGNKEILYFGSLPISEEGICNKECSLEGSRGEISVRVTFLFDDSEGVAKACCDYETGDGTIAFRFEESLDRDFLASYVSATTDGWKDEKKVNWSCEFEPVEK